MGKTSIEWTDASWNPIVGCTEISPGCANCYAARLAATRLKKVQAYEGLVIAGTQRNSIESAKRGPYRHARWSGQVRLLPERLKEPLHWKKPRRIFVCDMGDLFHEGVSGEEIAKVFLVMQRSPQHTFQVLTKRAARMRLFCTTKFVDIPLNLPLPNVWLGVSVENQHFADERIPLLLDTPAAVRWISAEPLLGPVDLDSENLTGLHALGCGEKSHAHVLPMCTGLDWVVCGGESGANARPMDPDWARSLRDQCRGAGVPFFFKQWGEWLPVDQQAENVPFKGPREANAKFLRFGKKAAGRELDGTDWNEFPKVAP